jgi:hypothetical protein
MCPLAGADVTYKRIKNALLFLLSFEVALTPYFRTLLHKTSFIAALNLTRFLGA